MNVSPPFVVVLAAAAAGVGQSTLAENLAVYLRGLEEDLPVAVISFDPGQDLAQTFEIKGHRASDCTPFFSGKGLESQLTLGQFGIEYLAAGALQDMTPGAFRRTLRATRFPGILIIDAGPLTQVAASAALQSADLVLAPVKNAAGLAPLAEIRRELKMGGGGDQMLCLIPALLDTQPPGPQQLDLLRFAAAERGCQVLDGEFERDDRLPTATAGYGGSILTRLPGSSAHHLLRDLAGFVLQKFADGPNSRSHQQRLRMDAALPHRAKRVELSCPLCQKLALQEAAHYCEALPQRRRWLLHADCLKDLLSGCRVQPFWLKAEEQVLVLRTGIEGVGLTPELKLLITRSSGAVLESEQFSPAPESGWQTLVLHATGRTLAEQLPALIMIYPAVSGTQCLSADQYVRYVNWRRRVRAELESDL
ncbi:hypothetical protein [Geopsychrobacter electrodiphilus]|uniref:hypothetical protein n=1 Tax=Geopsychrobacter electrodiphilus TaxID=225196 RepID=UPI00035F07AA|nr:hypothetical protein [Geopsychrobacter electrodiphilus]